MTRLPLLTRLAARTQGGVCVREPQQQGQLRLRRELHHVSRGCARPAPRLGSARGRASTPQQYVLNKQPTRQRRAIRNQPQAACHVASRASSTARRRANCTGLRSNAFAMSSMGALRRAAQAASRRFTTSASAQGGGHGNEPVRAPFASRPPRGLRALPCRASARTLVLRWQRSAWRGLAARAKHGREQRRRPNPNAVCPQTPPDARGRPQHYLHAKHMYEIGKARAPAADRASRCPARAAARVSAREPLIAARDSRVPGRRARPPWRAWLACECALQ